MKLVGGRDLDPSSDFQSGAPWGHHASLPALPHEVGRTGTASAGSQEATTLRYGKAVQGKRSRQGEEPGPMAAGLMAAEEALWKTISD